MKFINIQKMLPRTIYITYPPGCQGQLCNFVLKTSIEPKVGDYIVMKDDAIRVTGSIFGVGKAICSGDMISLDDARKTYRENLPRNTK